MTSHLHIVIRLFLELHLVNWGNVPTDAMALQMLNQALPSSERLVARVGMLSSVHALVSLQMLFPRKLLGAISTMVWRFTGMRSSVALEMLLPGEVLAAVQAVVRPLRLDALVVLDVPVQMLTSRIRLSAALPGAVQQGNIARVRSMAGMAHTLLLLLRCLLLLAVMGWLASIVRRYAAPSRVGASRPMDVFLVPL